MTTISPQPKGRDRAVLTLNALIQVLNIAKDACSIPPAQVAFGSVSVLLTMIRDTMANQQDYIDIGSTCANVCKVLDRGLNGKRLDELSRSVLEAIQHLTTTVANIQRKIDKQVERNAVSRFFHAMSDKDAIAAWKQDLLMILQIFNTELSVNNHVVLLDIRRDVRAGHGGTNDQRQSTRESIPIGELPPPQPRACFGREELIEKIVGLADTLNPIALIGPGGIGKTSVALAVLHHNRIKDRFGSNRRFIRCDQFPASLANFLRRLSKVIGAGVENPEDLVPLRSFLSSEEMFIVLDNAESILDPQGPDGREIYRVVEELSQIGNICLTITSRITTVPPDCETLEVPALSIEAAHDTFYRIYKHRERPDAINDILRRLDYHPLSITLLATVAHQNKWDNSRLTKEWERRQTSLLQTEHSDSLAATIELSLASPMFKKLGPCARELLGVVAFFPQGVDENNLDRLFPAVSNVNIIFDKFCILSLAYRSHGFVTMLAPLRDYLCPIDPTQSLLLCATKKLYFTRLSVDVAPHIPGFQDTRWIVSEDTNVEHLLDIFTSIDTNSEDVWEACDNFLSHLYWHKPRQTVLRSRIEQLSDGHRLKAGCLFHLSRLFYAVGNWVEQKRLLTAALKLRQERGSDHEVAQTLNFLSEANRLLGLCEEGIKQVKEVLDIYERLGETAERANTLTTLAQLLFDNDQLDAAEEASSQALSMLPENGSKIVVYQSNHLLGNIYRSSGKIEKAIHHYEVALGIASSFNWPGQQFWTHYCLARLFSNEAKFDDAHAHIEQAKLQKVDDVYCLGRAVALEAEIWYHQHRFDVARSEVLRAQEIFEELGSAGDLEICRTLLTYIGEEEVGDGSTSESDPRVLGGPFSSMVNAEYE